MTDTINVPLDDMNNHAIAVTGGFNANTGRWDLWVGIGNIKSKKEMDDIADKVAEIMRREFGAEMLAQN